MTDIRYTGEALAVAQVDKFTPATVEVDDIFTLTITGYDGTSHVVNFTATAATVANVTAGLSAAWNAATHALCTPITASDQTTYLDLTADIAGDAFSVASTTTDGGGNDTQTMPRAAVTANSGPKDWSVATNWDGGAVPGGAGSQNVYIENATNDILYGLDQSGIANTLDSLNIGHSFTGKIGTNGATGHSGTYLQIKASALDIGYHYGSGSPTGSGRLKIDLGTVSSTVTIHNTGTNTDTGKPSVRLLATNATTTISVHKGKVGVAFEAGETSTVLTITEGYVSNIKSDSDLHIGTGVTLTTLAKTGGDCDLGCAATTVTNDGGDMVTHGSGEIETLNVFSGTVTSNSAGKITGMVVKGNGIVDFSKSSAARTVEAPVLNPTGKIIYDPAIVTMTSKIQPTTADGKVTYSAA